MAGRGVSACCAAYVVAYRKGSMMEEIQSVLVEIASELESIRVVIGELNVRIARIEQILGADPTALPELPEGGRRLMMSAQADGGSGAAY